MITCLQVILITEAKTNYVVHQFSLSLRWLFVKPPDPMSRVMCSAIVMARNAFSFQNGKLEVI